MSIKMQSTRTDTTGSTVSLRNDNLTLNKSELMAGLQAGIGAGYTMGMVALVVSWIHSWGIWTPFNDVAGALIPALGTGVDFNPLSVIFGIIVHFSIAIILGLAFAALYSGVLKLTFNLGVPVVIGFIFSLVTWLAARYIALPLLGSQVYGAPAFLIAHMVFGATLGLLYPLMPARRTNARVN